MKVIRILLPLLLFGLFTFFSWQQVPTAVNAQVIPSEATATSGAQINLDITPYLGLDCMDDVDLETIIGIGGNVYSKITCSVITNSLDGYTISIDNATALTHETNPAYTIPALENPGQLNQPANATRWALNPDISAKGDDLRWRSSGTLYTFNKPTPNIVTGGAMFETNIGVSVGQNASLIDGQYLGSFTLTLSAI